MRVDALHNRPVLLQKNVLMGLTGEWESSVQRTLSSCQCVRKEARFLTSALFSRLFSLLSSSLSYPYYVSFSLLFFSLFILPFSPHSPVASFFFPTTTDQPLCLAVCILALIKCDFELVICRFCFCLETGERRRCFPCNR